MVSRRQTLKKLAAVVLLLATTIPLWACRARPQISVAVAGVVATAQVAINGSVTTFEGTVDQNGCISWNYGRRCKGRTCGLQSGSRFNTTCQDPLLAEWPTGWTLTSAAWDAPAEGLTGNILVTPASTWVVPQEFGSVITDPGYSAWVMKLDAQQDIGPTDFNMRLVFNIGTPRQAGCVEGIEITTLERVGQPFVRYFVPADSTSGLNFTAYAPGDTNVVCLELPTPAMGTNWGRLKSIFH